MISAHGLEQATAQRGCISQAEILSPPKYRPVSGMPSEMITKCSTCAQNTQRTSTKGRIAVQLVKKIRNVRMLTFADANQ